MKVICIHNNHEIGNKNWDPGKIYNRVIYDKGTNNECEYITCNDEREVFKLDFVNKLDISFMELRLYNLDKLEI